MSAGAGGLTCSHCTAATNGVVLCARCQTTAAMSLRKVAEYHEKLFALGHETPRVRRRSEVANPTLNMIVSEPAGDTRVEIAAAETTTMLVGWVRVLIDDRPGLVWPANSVAAMATYLREHLRTIALLDWAGAMVQDLLTYERRLQRIVSGNESRWNSGPCGALTGEGPDDFCPFDLAVSGSSTYVRCSHCGARWAVEDRRKIVIEHARDLKLPVSEIARAAVVMLDGEPSVERLIARLHKWVQRKQLDDYGVRVIDGRPQRVYQVGEVMDLLTRETRSKVEATKADA